MCFNPNRLKHVRTFRRVDQCVHIPFFTYGNTSLQCRVSLG